MGYKQVNLDRPIKESLSNSTQINLGNKLGISHDELIVDFNNGGYRQNQTNETTVPMIATVNFVPSIGDSKKGVESGYTDAINTYYTMLRSKNSSLAAYQPLDVFKFSYALSQLNVVADDCKRKIRSLFTPGEYFSINFNRGIQTALFKDAADIHNSADDVANYITKFNQIVESANQIVFPKFFQINNRYHKLMSAIYAEDPEMTKTQLIIFKPVAIWRLVLDASDPMVGNFKYEDLSNLTLDQELDLLRDMVNQMGNDTDQNNIMAEIRKAVETNCFRLETIPTNPTANDILFSLDVIDLVRNATYVGDIAQPSTAYIYENNYGNFPYLTHYNSDAIYASDPEHIFVSYNYNMDSSWGLSYNYFDTRNTKRPIHSHADSPDKATAYNITAGFSDIFSYPTSPYEHLANYATEVYTHFKIYTYDSVLQAFTTVTFQSYLRGSISSYYVAKLHSFSCAPDVICYGFDSNDRYLAEWIHSDIDNVTFVDTTTIAKVQSVAIQCSLVYDKATTE